MERFTKVDLDCMITLSGVEFPHQEIEDGYVINGRVLGDDPGSGFQMTVRLLEDGNVQRLEFAGSLSRCIPKEMWPKAFDLCNQWSSRYNYIQTWFSEDDGKFHVCASIDNPYELPKGWLIVSFMKPCKSISCELWTMAWRCFGGIEEYVKMKSAAVRRDSNTEQEKTIETRNGSSSKAGCLWYVLAYFGVLVLLWAFLH